MEITTPEWAKSAWEFEAEYGTDYFYLRVDEESTKAEFQECYDYWEEQLSLYDLPPEHKKGLWSLLAYLDEQIESA